MKKQYRHEQVGFNRERLYVYHDGELIETKILEADEKPKEVCKLKSNGYAYGYTTEEVEEAKKWYEERLMNAI